MFWNKKKKEKKAESAAAIPEFKENGDDNFSLSFDKPVSMPEPKIITDRLYVISRGNIDLKGAQDITIHAALAHPEYVDNLTPEEHVDLVWCSAYPDAIFGEMELPELLVSYVQQSEGERYLNGESQLIPIEGEKDGEEYYILILVHMDF